MLPLQNDSFLGLLSITRMLALTGTRAQGMPDGSTPGFSGRCLVCA